MEKLAVISFYKYVKIEKPEIFTKKLLSFCKETNLLGRILVGKEGINGSVSGTQDKLDKFVEKMKNDDRFSDMEINKEDCVEIPFTKMKVKLKKEIVNFGGVEVDLKNVGNYLSPEEFFEIYEKEKDNLIILDARNDYEFKAGKFKDATHLNIKTFRDFPKKALEQLKGQEDKKIVMYCTGGIRCEKASAFLVENGFKDVNQIHGGIITYGQGLPNTLWEGKCFVFDKRLLSGLKEESNKILEKCEICGNDSDLYRNCKNVNCDKLLVCCVECQRNLNGCCSKECFNEFKEQCKEKARLNQGRRKLQIQTV